MSNSAKEFWEFWNMPFKSKIYDVYDITTWGRKKVKTLNNVDYHENMTNGGWKQQVFYKTEDGRLKSSLEQVRYQSAKYHFTPGVDYGDYIHVKLLKELDNWYVTSLNDFFCDIKKGYKGVNTRDMVLTVDFRDCDFSYVASIDSIFDGLSIFKGVNVLLPDGDKALAPVSAWRFLSRANILNCDEVLKRIHTEIMLDKSGLLIDTHITRFNFNIKGFHIDTDLGLLFDDVIKTGCFEFNSMLKSCKKLKCVTGCINNDGCENPINANGLFDGCTNLERVERSVFNKVQIIKCNNMFNGCKKLVDCGLDLSMFKDVNFSDTSECMFAGCEKIDTDSIKDLIEGLSKRMRVHAVFYGCTSDKIHGTSMKLYSSYGIFYGMGCKVIDLSGVEFIPDGVASGILDFFHNNPNFKDNKSVYRRHNKNDLQEFVDNKIKQSLIIVNKTMPIHECDSEFFNIIDAEGLSTDEIVVKSRLAALIGTSNKSICIV